MDLLTLDDLDPALLRRRRVFTRVDFNAPLEDGVVVDDTRLEAALPTLRQLHAAGARIVLASHCGRPDDEPDPRYSLRPVATRLGELLASAGIDSRVVFAEDCVGEPARTAVDALHPGEMCLLENLRFHSGEKKNEAEFTARLAELGEIYVGDAFGTAHRAHASVVGVAERLPHKAAGRLLVREVEALGSLLDEPARPFVGILGGAKIEGKIDALKNLLPRLDTLLLGGGMANTFLAARGYELADSLVEVDRIALAAEVLARAEAADTRVVLPDDLVITDDLDRPRRVETVAADAVRPGTKAVDVGDATRRRFLQECAGAATLFWNGPLGVFETPPFDAGTLAMARCLGKSRGFTVVGGGETVAAVQRAGVAGTLGHVSTGGGASLDLLAGKTLPGVAILEKADPEGPR